MDSSRVTEKLSAICGKATFAIVPSRTNINTSSNTDDAVNHGFLG